jgi:aspartate/glutamate/glutamine transport system substrate-binding protein
MMVTFEGNTVEKRGAMILRICGRWNKTILSLLPVIFVILCLAFPGQSRANTLEQIKARGELRVGVKTTTPVFGFIGEHGENKGFDVDIARWLSKNLFGNAEAIQYIAVTPLDEVVFLNTGRIDILVGTAIIAERRKEVDFSIPYFVTGHLILLRSNEKPISYRDLSGKKVATVAGSASDMVISTSGATSVRFNTIAEAVRALKEDRVDAIVAKDEILFEVEKENPELSTSNWQPFAVEHIGFAVRKGDNEWLSYVNDKITTMQKTSEHRKLLEKWFGMARTLLYERMLSLPLK